MTTKILSATLDFIFKLIFGDEKNSDILGSFLMAVLNPPYDEFDSLQIIDPNLPREFEEDKLGILDVKLKLKSGKIIDVEIQVKLLPHLRERIVFYTSKMITEQIKSGNDYHVVKPVVTILVADFVMFPDDTAYHHNFEMYDRASNVLLSELTGVHILELPKLPKDDDNTPVWTWAKFIETVDEEELNMLAQRNATLNKAVAIRMELSRDERLRLLAEAKEKARRDEADFLWGARHEGREEGRQEGANELAKILSDMGVTPDLLSEAVKKLGEI